MWLTSSALEPQIRIQLRRFANIRHSSGFRAHTPLSRANWSIAASRDTTGESTRSIPLEILPAWKEESDSFARFANNVPPLIHENQDVPKEILRRAITTSLPHEMMSSTWHTGLPYMKKIPSSMQVPHTLVTPAMALTF